MLLVQILVLAFFTSSTVLVLETLYEVRGPAYQWAKVVSFAGLGVVLLWMIAVKPVFGMLVALVLTATAALPWKTEIRDFREQIDRYERTRNR